VNSRGKFPGYFLAAPFHRVMNAVCDFFIAGYPHRKRVARGDGRRTEQAAAAGGGLNPPLIIAAAACGAFLAHWHAEQASS
jgi:hypothetical protein